MTGLPDGWRRTDLGSLGLYFNGRGFKKSEWRDHGRPIIRIQNLTGSSRAFNYFDGVAEERYIARSGDLLVSWAATLGSYIWQGPEAVVNQHIFKVQSNIDKKFHKHLMDFKLQALMRQTHGSGMVHITRGKFDSLPVMVPQALDEQRRIVDILEDHLSRLDAAESALTRSRVRLKRFHQASLVACLSAAAAEAASTTQTTVGALARVGTGATPLKSRTDYYAGGSIPWVTSADLAQGFIERASHFVTDLALKETAIKLWPVGTILVAMYGEGKTRGTVAELGIAATTNQACAAIELHDSDPSLKSWIRLVLDSSYWSMRRMASGGVQPNLNLGLVRSIEVPVPFPETRARLLRAREAHLDAQQMLATELALSEIRVRSLRRSLLAAAFAGRLTGRSTDMELVEEMAGV